MRVKITIGSRKFVHFVAVQPYHAHAVQHLLADSNVLAAWHLLCQSRFPIPHFCLDDCCLAANNCLKISYPRILSSMRSRTQMPPIQFYK